MKKRILSLLVVASMIGTLLIGCGSSTTENGTEDKTTKASASTEGDSAKKVLRVGMECAYAPFNWTQETDEVANGDTAELIYGTNYYAYGYDVMMAKKIAIS